MAASSSNESGSTRKRTAIDGDCRKSVKIARIDPNLTADLNGEDKKVAKGAWFYGLTKAISDPSLHIVSDERLVVIKDLYPKSKHHYLVIPKANIRNLKDLTFEHLDLLKHIDHTGHQVASSSDGEIKFRFGYHAIPSMGHLHMHVISEDFDSPCLKNEKHWNSFTTDYFINSSDIIEQVKNTGCVTVDTSKSEQLLKQPLRCHICRLELRTIPALKVHLKSHD